MIGRLQRSVEYFLACNERARRLVQNVDERRLVDVRGAGGTDQDPAFGHTFSAGGC